MYERSYLLLIYKSSSYLFSIINGWFCLKLSSIYRKWICWSVNEKKNIILAICIFHHWWFWRFIRRDKKLNEKDLFDMIFNLIHITSKFACTSFNLRTRILFQIHKILILLIISKRTCQDDWFKINILSS